MSMSKRLLWFNGLAIIAVAIHHAAAYSLLAMFEWTDRYQPVTVPNYDQLGNASYYILMILRSLLTFAGAVFFFISGYFVGITAKGNQTGVGWKMISSRIKVLLIPFLLWTMVRYVMLRQIPRTVDDILAPYHWIPLLIQFYLISPFIVSMAKRNWKVLLLAIIVMNCFFLSLSYASAFGSAPAKEVISYLPNWVIFWNLPFWFPFGVVMGIYLVEFKPWLVRYRWYLLAGAVVMTLLVLVEYEAVDRLSGPGWLGPEFGGFTKVPYSLFVILTFLAFDKAKLPLFNQIAEIGPKSLGIYLGNIPSIYVTAVLMYHYTPWLLGHTMIYFAILTVVGLAGPLLLMELVRRSPIRHRYRLLFG